MYGKKKYPGLAKIARRVYSICSSSAAAERCWSVYGFIHSKVRNRLTEERAEKLVFIYMNSVLADNTDKELYFDECN